MCGESTENERATTVGEWSLPESIQMLLLKDRTTRNNITMNLSNIKEYEHHIIGLNI